jgi:DNA-binding NtrC family response regulator
MDDEVEIRELLSNILKAHGYTVLEASSVGKALQICKQHTGAIHLIIADVVMPGMVTGLELLRHVASLRPEMKRLCISGYMDEAMFRQELPSPAFLQKPFTPDDLLRIVHTLLDAPLDSKTD